MIYLRPFDSKRNLLRLTLAMLCAAALSGSATAQPTPAAAPAAMRFKAVLFEPDQSTIEQNLDEYRKSNPQIGLQYLRTDIGSENAVTKLLAGEIDLVTLHGPVLKDGSKADSLLPLLQSKGCRPFVFGWQILAVVVHPSNPRESIEPRELDVNAKLFGEVVTTPRPPTFPTTYLADDRINRAVNELGAYYGRYFRVTYTTRQLAPDALAHSRQGIGMMCLDDRLAASGLKILPLRAEPDSPAVLPTLKSIKSGAYPYYTYSVLATRPGAPPELLKLVENIQEKVKARRYFVGDHWVPEIPDLESPMEKETLFPAAETLKVPESMTGAVAVLPFETSNSLFLVADQSHREAVEASLTRAIGKQGDMKTVDRAYLQQILAEQKRILAGKPLEKPLLAADLLLSSSFVTEQLHTYLVVDAVHGVNGCLIGKIKIPVDPTKLDQIEETVSPLIDRWWPGVLARLQQVRTLPVWAMRVTQEPTVMLPSNELANGVRSEIDQAPLVFLAEYQPLTAARRELILSLLGITATQAGNSTPAADYLAELDFATPTKPILRILKGADLSLIEARAVAANGLNKQDKDWLQGHLRKSQAGRLVGERAAHPPSKPASAQAQADLEYQRGIKLRAECEAFRDAQYEKRRSTGRHRETAEEKQTLGQYESAIAAAFQRAAQLDPTREQVSYEEIMAKLRNAQANYNSYNDLAAASGLFVEMFPQSKNLNEVLQQAYLSRLILVRFLRAEGVSNNLQVPAGVDVAQLRLDHQQAALRFLVELNERSLSNTRGIGTLLELYRREVVTFRQLGGSEAEITQALARYGRTFDALPELAPHSDFLRLDQLAHLEDQKAYLALIEQMQARWPTPDSPYWKTTAEDTLQQMCDLFRSDPRGTSFYWWLRAKGKAAN